ncbi:hypothetical protein ACOSQ3_018389 [Xanthoceras sorbifolium]
MAYRLQGDQHICDSAITMAYRLQGRRSSHIKLTLVILYDGFPSKIILVKIACKDATISVLSQSAKFQRA